MSNYGLLVRNADHEIQIDSTYRNLSLDQEGATTLHRSNSETGYYHKLYINSSHLVPVFLMQPPSNGFVALRSYHKNNNNFDRIDIAPEKDGLLIDWQCYRENRTPSNETYGFRVFNPNHNLCFDSGKHYFKIHSVHSLTLEPAYNQSLHYKDISHPDISNPYYILTPSSFCYEVWPVGSTGYSNAFYYLMGLKKLSSTSVRVGWFLFLTETWLAYTVKQFCVNNTVKLIVCRP